MGNSVQPKSGSYYMRQVTSSVNFRTGGDLNDFMHGWLNYQIEHTLGRSSQCSRTRRPRPSSRPSAPSTTCLTCRRTSSSVSRRPLTSWWAKPPCAASTRHGRTKTTPSSGSRNRHTLDLALPGSESLIIIYSIVYYILILFITNYGPLESSSLKVNKYVLDNLNIMM